MKSFLRGTGVAFGVLVFVTFVSGATDLNSWQWLNPRPTGVDLFSVAFANHHYIAVGDKGTILASPDGRTWVARNFDVSSFGVASFNSVASNGARFVAVGGSPGKALIVSSTDGVNWVKETSSANDVFQSICWSGSEFVAMCYNGNSYTSPNGVTWSFAGSTGGGGMRSVAAGFNFSGGLGLIIMPPAIGTWVLTLNTNWQMFATTSVMVAVGGPNVFTRTGSGSWAYVSSISGGFHDWQSVSTNGSQFVLAGSSGEMATSSDGLEWQLRSPPGGAGSNAVWSQNEFLCTSNDGNTLASPDGVTWTKRGTSSTIGLTFLATGENGIVAVGRNGRIATTTAGNTWDSESVSATYSNLGPVAYGNGIFVAPIKPDATYSAAVVVGDGLYSWERVVTGASNQLNAVVFGKGRFVAVGAGGLIQTSSDGRVWTIQTSGTSSPLNSVFSDGTVFVAVGDSGVLLTSSDGISWTSRTSNTIANLYSIARSSSQYVVSGSGGTIIKSSDGATWAKMSTGGSTAQLQSVVWTGSQFVAIEYSYGTTAVFTSVDGVSWSRHSVPEISVVKNVAFGDGFLLASGGFDGGGITNGHLYSSTDGVNWNACRVGNGVAGLNGAFWDGSRWIVSGDGGTLLSSSTSSSSEPKFSQQPASVTSATLPVTLSSEATGGGLTYQWYKDGLKVAGENKATIDVSSPGDYTVIAGNALGTTTSRFARVTQAAPEPGRIVNMSVRTLAGYEGGQLIVGFVMTGGAKNVLIRASGPAIGAAPFNVPGTMVDPKMELHGEVDGVDTVLLSNDNWDDGGLASALSTTFASVGAFGWSDSASKDSALSASISASRTVFVKSSVPNQSGVVLVEAYDLGSGNSPRLINVSTRNHVGFGGDILIAGFVINGNVPKKILIRGIGPAIGAAPFNVPGVLPDPKLEVHTNLSDQDTVVASNDDWSEEPGAGEAFSSAGAFPLPSGSKDAAVIVTLPPGAYTAVVSDVTGAVGEALAEVYEVP